MKTIRNITMFICVLTFSVNHVVGQQTDLNTGEESSLYLFEREMSTDMDDRELKEFSSSARKVVDEIGAGVEWLHSYVTDDKMICVFRYENKEAIAEHARKAGFSVDDLKKVSAKIGPGTADN